MIVAPGRVDRPRRRRRARRRDRGGRPRRRRRRSRPTRRVIDVTGKVVHAAFIDPYVSTDRLAGRSPRSAPKDDESGRRRRPASAAPRSRARPRTRSPRSARRSARSTRSRSRTTSPRRYRRLGFAVVAAVPTSGVLRGQRRGRQPRRGPMRPGLAAGRPYDLARTRAVRRAYGPATTTTIPPRRWAPSPWSARPSSTRSGGATRRRRMPRRPRARRGPASWRRRRRSCRRPRAGRPVVFETTDVLSLLRAARIAREMKLKARYVGAGDEYRLRDAGRRRAARPRPAGRLSRSLYQLGRRRRVAGRAARAPARVSTARPRTRSGCATRVSRFRSRPRASTTPSTFAGACARRSARGPVAGRRARRGHDRAGAAARARRPAGNRSKRARSRTSSSRPASRFAEESRGLGDLDRRGADRDPARRRRRDTGRDGLSGRRRSPRRRTCAPSPGPRGRAGRGADGGRRARRDGLDARAPAGILENADVARRRREDRRGRAGARPRRRAPSRSTDAASTSRPASSTPLAHRDRRPGQRVDARRHGRGADPRRPRSVRRRHLPRARRRHDRGQRPARLGQRDRRPERDRQVALGRRPGRPPLRRRAGRDQVRARREPEAVQLAATRSRGTRDAHGRRGADPRAVPRGARLPAGARRSTGRPRRSRARRPIPPRPDLQLEAIAEILEGKRDDPLPLLPQGRDPRDDPRRPRSSASRSRRSSTCSRATRSPTRSRSTAPGLDLLATGGPTSSRSTTRSRTTAPLMRERGVLVSFNSDSDELARRLNLEAAKAVKYGGVPPADALAFVTLNPGEAARHRRRASARSSPARTPTSSSGAATRSRPRRSRSRPGSTGRSTSTARPTCRGAPALEAGARGPRREGEGAEARRPPEAKTKAAREGRRPTPKAAR